LVGSQRLSHHVKHSRQVRAALCGGLVHG
jgi:hypothetical protein